jgi:superoxide reductase
MTKRDQIFKCTVCGNIVEMVGTGVGTLVCCGQSMKSMKENSNDASIEKHVPVVTISASKTSIKVGEIEHPMEETHFIEWIELIVDDRVDKQFLHAGEKPETEFNIAPKKYIARAYCNVHGLWKSEN